MVFCYLFCFLTYSILIKLHINEFPKDFKYIILKKSLVYIMGIQFLTCNISYYNYLDFFSLLLVSFYEPIIAIEQIMASLLIISMTFNSVFFMFAMLLFIFSLKYDLFYISLNLSIRPDIEYFLDYEDNIKILQETV